MQCLLVASQCRAARQHDSHSPAGTVYICVDIVLPLAQGSCMPGMACYHLFALCSCQRYSNHCIAAAGWNVQAWLGDTCTSGKSSPVDTACAQTALLQLTGQAPQSRQAWPGGVWVRTIIAWRSTQCLMPPAWLQHRRRLQLTRGMGGGQAMCRLTIQRPSQQGTCPE